MNQANLPKLITLLILSGVALLVLWYLAANTFERVDAGEIVIIQSVTGHLTVYTDPGYKLLFFGKATHYHKSIQFWFSNKNDQGSAKDDALSTRFNDGGTAQISGSARIDLPITEKEMLDLHCTYGSEIAVEQNLIRTAIERAVFMTGSLMSSKESYGEKKTELLNDIQEQALHGIYKTITHDAETIDPITGDKKHHTAVEVAHDEQGNILHQEESPFPRFHLNLYNLAINDVVYDDNIKKQIETQQNAIMQVQTSIANAKRAEQDALTTIKQGEADAAQAKWAQEKINAQLVAEAEGKRQAADLDRQAAEFTKARTILLAEGEAEAKKLLAAANNSLDQKLKAYIDVNTAWANALQNSTHPLVPNLIFGGSSSSSSTNAGANTQDFMNLVTAKTAHDLSLDLNTAAPAATH